MPQPKSNCLITQRISGNCYDCHVRIDGAHIISGEGGLARILCEQCCPEHGTPKPKAMGAAEEAEPPMFVNRDEKTLPTWNQQYFKRVKAKA